MGRKKNKKLSVKKETLRRLEADQLEQAAGGTILAVSGACLPGGGISIPRTGTCTCTLNGWGGGYY